MSLEFNSFLIIFIIVVSLIVCIYPIIGYVEQKNKKPGISEDEKLKGYRETIILLWIPVFIILLLLPLSNIGINELGLRNIDLNNSSFKKWVVYPLVGLYLLYLLYNTYCIILLKFSKASRKQSTVNLPEVYKTFLPITKKEKKTWDFVAISAGISEEIIYRGYLFYAIGVLFPNLSIFIILLISSFVFGLGHIYQGYESIKPTILGLFFGLFYIVFDSIFPVILIHIIQDLVVRDLIDEE
jgi:membrane protease YdiL (CAAX protease family)